MEPYRPYICMMNARSKALAAIKRGAYRSALSHVNTGLRAIKAFFRHYGDPKTYQLSAEAHILKTLKNEIRRQLPGDPVKEMKKQLSRAVHEERYEEAARLRDELHQLMRKREDIL